MGPVGVQEMLVIFIVALVLFGPKKLPELGKTLGKAITEFRRAQNELKSTFEHHMKELEQENESIKEVTRSFTSDIYNNSYDSSTYSGYTPDTYESTPEPATPSHPSTVGEPAIQGAESAVSHETAGNGTVPRTAPTFSTEPKAEPAPQANPLPESSSVNS